MVFHSYRVKSLLVYSPSASITTLHVHSTFDFETMDIS